MKYKHSALTLGVIFTTSLIFLFSCRKINEGTEVGGGLIPPIDGITTFETFLPVETDNKLLVDSSQLLFSDNMAVGHINDPSFGITDADAYLNFSYLTYGLYPFVNKDSVKIDSVVLSLSYKAVYGDSNSTQTLTVYEIDQNSNPPFEDDTLYQLTQPGFQAATQLGQKPFVIKSVKDSILHIRGDTTQVANVIRIKLDTNFARRFVNYDTTNGSNGAFHNDSIFKTKFKGLAIKAGGTGNALTYIGPYDNVGTHLTIYYKVTKSGITDSSASLNFYHITNGQANIIKRIPGGAWATYLGNGNPEDDQIYLQSSPGSYGRIRIPALDTFRNSTIHRAELIFTRIPVPGDDPFLTPANLFLDRINNAGDTAFTFDQDMSIQYDPTTVAFSYNSALFGGFLRASDTTYRFTLTRYVQGIVTRKEPNNILRLLAPLRTVLYSNSAKTKVPLYITGPPGYGRVVLAGGNYAVPGLRARLRLVYSKI